MADLAPSETGARIVRVYNGNPDGVFESTLDIAEPVGTAVGSFGAVLEGGGDFDGDGFTDLFILDGDEGRLHYVAGGMETPTKVRASLVTDQLCPYFLRPTLARAGDVNGDGYSDVAAHCGPKLMVFAGGRTPELSPIWSHTLSDEAGFLGHDIVGGYDFGVDGFADLVMHGDAKTGANLLVLAGSATLSSADAPLTFTGVLDEDGLLRADRGLSAGDYDGDGRADLLVQVVNSYADLKLFSGGKTASAGSCASLPDAANKSGDWCRAAVATIEGRYMTQSNPDYPVGGSFGFVLAR